MNYTYELKVFDDDNNVIYRRSTSLPELIDRYVDDAKKTISDFWNDKKTIAIDDHDCHNDPEDGCQICADYYEKHGGTKYG